jgi:hypothetical protein
MEKRSVYSGNIIQTFSYEFEDVTYNTKNSVPSVIISDTVLLCALIIALQF